MSTEQNEPFGEAANAGEPEGENTSGSAANAGQSQAEHAAAESPADAAAETAESTQSLTVEDILAAEQTAEAKEAEAQQAESGESAAAAESSQKPAAENPYLEDLRRLTAEYANYRKRTEANAELEKQRAAAKVITPLLGVLDDLDRAAAHGDLPEGSAVAQVAQKLREALSRQGLTPFGEKGESFDPQIHEAIAQVPVPDAQPGTVFDVVERGYRLGEIELRPAKVAVVAQNG